MLKLLRFCRSVVLLPVKLGAWTSLLAVGLLIVGTLSPQLWEIGSQALANSRAWFEDSSADATFDPQVLLSPDKELNLIRKVSEEVEPRFRRAQVLIRKQQAEIEYLREQCRFIEARVPRKPADDSRTAAEVLSRLAEIVSDPESASDEDRQRFEAMGGPAWVALNKKRDALEKSLGHLMRLQERVEFLHAKLGERRLHTLRYAPEQSDAASGHVDHALQTGEFAESETILKELHETLFKTVYALDPSLLAEAGRS